MRPSWTLLPGFVVLALTFGCAQESEEPRAPEALSETDPLLVTPLPELWQEMQEVQQEIHRLAEAVDYEPIPGHVRRVVELFGGMFRQTQGRLDRTHRVLAKRALGAVSALPSRFAVPARSNWPGGDMDGALLSLDSTVRMVEKAFRDEIHSGPAVPAGGAGTEGEGVAEAAADAPAPENGSETTP